MLAAHPLASWAGFAAILVILLALELGVIGRNPVQSERAAVRWSLVVIGFAAIFFGLLRVVEGSAAALQFATGYVIELSLSVDNLLVFIIVLEYFAVPATLQPTALKWGILGAIVMRGVMIGAGALVLARLDWVIYLLGALLIATGLRMLARSGGEPTEIENNPLLRVARRILPIGRRFAGTAFFTREGGRFVVTPLLLVILTVEWTDLVFATDSIPAIFAITRDPFLIYTSNILAIIGLRALFFVLAALIARFRYLRFGAATVLVFVGATMLLERWVVVPTEIMLVTVAAVLGVSVVASGSREKREPR